MTAKTDNILTESRALIDTIVILSAEIESLREENKSLRDEIREQNKDHRALISERNVLLRENIALKEDLAEDLAQAEEDRSMNENRAEAYWSAISQRDEARLMYCDFVSKSNPAIHDSPLNVAQSQGWGDLFLPEPEERSDSDPVTGVQYGDLV